jgi:secreted trypsin-like serine protease
MNFQPKAIWLLSTLTVWSCGTAELEAEPDELAIDTQEVVGGTKASEGEFPFMTPLFIGYPGTDGEKLESQSCGGSLIAPDLILTAAHCIHGFPDFQMRAGYGKNKLSELPRDDKGLLVTNGVHASAVKEMWMHPSYDPTTFDSDVALIRLKQPFANARTISYFKATGNEPPTGTRLVVAGWGATNKRGTKYPDELRKGTVPLFDQKACEKAIRAVDPTLAVTDTMICAGGRKVDTCFGDSGGPMMARTNQGNYRIVGLTSWGAVPEDPNAAQCAIPKTPGVYARVSKLDAWIESCRTDSSKCPGARPSTCFVSGYCKKTDSYFNRDLSDAHKDRASCLAQAEVAAKECQNPTVQLDYSSYVYAHFSDGTGSKRSFFPSCFVTGVCKNKKHDLDTGVSDGSANSAAACHALAPKYFAECGNRPQQELITTVLALPTRNDIKVYRGP